jgi:parallel beta-helix repeat protein
VFFPERSCVTFVVVFLLGFFAVAADAAVIRVPADFATIQGGINAAADGDTVQVAPGTYLENIGFLGKAIRVASEQGPAVTIIDGNHSGPVVRFTSGETRSSVLEGFTIQNGVAGEVGGRGGGIRIENASATITGNVITLNWAREGGAGISSVFGSPLIQRNTITNNGSPQGTGFTGGGGVAIFGGSDAQLLDNTITGNAWLGNGGGVSLVAAWNPTLINNRIADNYAGSGGSGGGIWVGGHSYGPAPTGEAKILNNVIANNQAFQGGGIWATIDGDGITTFGATPVITQNLIIGNSDMGAGGGGVYLGVWYMGAAGPSLTNNTISGNNGSPGSVMLDGYTSQVQLTNNIIVAPARQIGVACHSPYTPSFRSNDVFSPSGSAYAGCGNQVGVSGTHTGGPDPLGDISADPLFRDPATGDYHLQTGSPAIDSGSPVQDLTADLDGVVRPQDGDGNGVFAYDMGVYEAPTIDLIPPVTTATVTPTPNSGGWNNTSAAVTLNATDNAGGSGVRSVTYWLTGAQTSPNTSAGNPAMVSVSTEGTTTVHYSAADNAGNTETPKGLNIKIDTTSPVISGMPAPGCNLWPANHKLVPVATLSAADSLSGLASFSVTVISSEPDSGAGDIVIDGSAIQLRADRSPSGNGRVYTITAIATDFADNSVTATATCTVGNR